MILLLLLSLCATECRVHRNDIPVDEQWLCRDAEIQGKPCWVQSHWFSCTVVEKCDTVKLPTWGRYPVFKGDRFFEADSNTYVIRCHPETTLVDSGVTDLEPTNTPKSGDVKVWNGKSWEWRSQPQTLDSAELADLREMLRTIERQMQFLICMDTLIVDERTGFEGKMDEIYKKLGVRPRIVRDSCECVYGDRKGK